MAPARPAGGPGRGDALAPRAPTGRRQDEGATTATLYDVARLAGVSTATVSRVLHGHDRVSDETRHRVQKVIDELGYVPDVAAQSLSRRRKEVIGLIVLERTSHQYDIESMSLLFGDEVLHGVEARLRGVDWSLLITYLDANDEHRAQRLHSLSGKVDGLLITEGIASSEALARLAGRLPVVVVAGNPNERGVDVVAADNYGGSSALVAHLLDDHGRRRLYAVDGPPGAPDARQRRRALDDAVAGRRAVRLVGSFSGDFSVESGFSAGTALLSEHRGELPDGVVCANDQMAIGVMMALRRAKVAVPGKVSVVGFDDIYPGSMFHPPLTTVHQPMRQLGEHACDRLLNRIADPDLPPVVELLATELVTRRSCGCPPGTQRRRPVSRPAPADERRRSGPRARSALRGAAGAGAGGGAARTAGSRLEAG